MILWDGGLVAVLIVAAIVFFPYWAWPTPSDQ